MVDNDTENVQAMIRDVEGVFQGNITGLTEGTVVEYYITAADAFLKSTDAMNGTDYFSFTVGSAPTPPPGDFPLVPIAAVGVIAVIGVVIVWYMFVYKKE
jgi:hypothetical protein